MGKLKIGNEFLKKEEVEELIDLLNQDIENEMLGYENFGDFSKLSKISRCLKILEFVERLKNLDKFPIDFKEWESKAFYFIQKNKNKELKKTKDFCKNNGKIQAYLKLFHSVDKIHSSEYLKELEEKMWFFIKEDLEEEEIEIEIEKEVLNNTTNISNIPNILNIVKIVTQCFLIVPLAYLLATGSQIAFFIVLTLISFILALSFIELDYS